MRWRAIFFINSRRQDIQYVQIESERLSKPFEKWHHNKKANKDIGTRQKPTKKVSSSQNRQYIPQDWNTDQINTELVDILSVNEWKKMISVIKWFKKINKRWHKFLQFDIKDFFPSIKETLLYEPIQFAKEHVPIARKDLEAIFHAWKSVLHDDGEPWVKKDSGSFLDVTMGAYDRAEVCELIGIYVIFNREKYQSKILGYIEMTD